MGHKYSRQKDKYDTGLRHWERENSHRQFIRMGTNTT